jgi:hypothetical protein
MTVTFFPNDKENPPGKLADAEVHFSGGPLDGLKLLGFALWERKGGGRNVTFPSRQYSVNGERRSFALLRPGDARQDRLRDLSSRPTSSTRLHSPSRRSRHMPERLASRGMLRILLIDATPAPRHRRGPS